MKSFAKTPVEVLRSIDSNRRERPLLDVPFAAPSDGDERVLAEIWAEVLNIQEIGLHDNFFALGGDSLHIIRVLSRVLEQFHCEVTFGEFFSSPTVVGIAQIIASHNGAVAAGPRLSASNQGAPVDARLVRSAEAQGDDSVARARGRALPRLSHEGDPVAITSIVIPTCERSDELHRCLLSVLENTAKYERKPRIVIVDSSIRENTLKNNKEAVQTAAKRFSASVVMLGPQEKRNIIRQLVRSGLDREVVDFGLDGLASIGVGTSGANRNMLLLATSGEAFLSLDDDTECRFASAEDLPESFQGIQDDQDAAADPADVWVFKDRQAIRDCIALRDVDFVGSHQELLGRQVADLATAASHEASSKEVLRLLASSGRVYVTLNGVVGDCGWGTPSQYFFVGDRSFRRLATSRASYDVGIESREMLRVSHGFTVSDRADSLMSTAFAADNRATLPPFVPLGRGSDAVFGQMLKLMQPLACYGHLPWAISHLPVEARRFWPGEALRSAGTVDLKGMMSAVVSRLAAEHPTTEKEWCEGMGRSLQAISEYASDDLLSFLAESERILVDREVAFLQRRLNRFASDGGTWTTHVEQYIEKAIKKTEATDGVVPVELLYGRDGATATTVVRRLLSLYGRLIGHWPHIVETAGRQKEELFSQN
jgi:hypothetical protein